MIPIFPKFRKLTLSDRGEIEKITSRFVPYSDFNFSSLYAYNTKNEYLLSYLNGNLVIRFLDYITGKPFLSFFGKHDVVNTINILLDKATDLSCVKILKLVPEQSLSKIISNKDMSNCTFIEDDDNFDYILSLHELSLLKGNKYQSNRRLANQFIERYPYVDLVECKILDPKFKKDVELLYEKWADRKKDLNIDIYDDVIAMRRLFKSGLHSNLIVHAIYDFDELIAFSIAEILGGGYAMAHFSKADIEYRGVYPFMLKSMAKKLIEKKCIYLNYEQDLGIPGLRKAKSLWRPIFFLKKYTISAK